MSLIVGPQSGLTVGLKSGVNADAGGGVVVPTDGPSNFRFPNSGAHFTALGIAAPNSLWLCQEASGTLADTLGALTLTLSGTGVTYNSAVAGYTRRGLASTDAATGFFSSTSSPNPATTSHLLFMYVLLSSTPAAVRTFCGIGTTTQGALRIETSPRFRAQFGGNLATGTTDPTGAVRLYAVQRDVTAGANRGARDTELLTPTATALAGQRVSIVAGGGASAPAATTIWACLYTGAEAEGLTNLRNKYQALSGLTVGW